MRLSYSTLEEQLRQYQNMNVVAQAAHAHVSRKRQRLIPESVTRCVTRCLVTKGTVENLNTLKGIVWRAKYGRFTTINISKYKQFTRRINKTYSHPVCPLYFLSISAVLSLLYRHCHSCQKTKE